MFLTALGKIKYDFIDIKLPRLIKENHHMPVARTGIPADKKYLYRADVYLGGKNGDKIKLGKPTIYDNNEQKYMYPNGGCAGGAITDMVLRN